MRSLLLILLINFYLQNEICLAYRRDNRKELITKSRVCLCDPHLVPECATNSTFNATISIPTLRCSTRLTIECASETDKLEILKAVYGLKSVKQCPENEDVYSSLIRKPCDETLTATQITKYRCNKKRICDFEIDNEFTNHCPCDPFKYFEVTYYCMRSIVKYDPITIPHVKYLKNKALSELRTKGPLNGNRMRRAIMQTK